jgi:hypothetical protein
MLDSTNHGKSLRNKNESFGVEGSDVPKIPDSMVIAKSLINKN